MSRCRRLPRSSASPASVVIRALQAQRDDRGLRTLGNGHVGQGLQQCDVVVRNGGRNRATVASVYAGRRVRPAATACTVKVSVVSPSLSSSVSTVKVPTSSGCSGNDQRAVRHSLVVHALRRGVTLRRGATRRPVLDRHGLRDQPRQGHHEFYRITLVGTSRRPPTPSRYRCRRYSTVAALGEPSLTTPTVGGRGPERHHHGLAVVQHAVG